MWPWEHAAFGYLLYTMSVHAWSRTSPTGQAVLVLLLATQLPDMIDKPLSWMFGLFPSGFAIAHSMVAVIPLLVLVLLASGAGRQRMHGTAFVIGYGSHLLGDVLYPLTRGEPPDLTRVLWPFVERSGYDEDLGLLGRTIAYLTEFIEVVMTDPSRLALLSALPAAAVVVWLIDGAPGVDVIVRTWRSSADRQ